MPERRKEGGFFVTPNCSRQIELGGAHFRGLFRRPVYTDGAVMAPLLFGIATLVFLWVELARGEQTLRRATAIGALVLAMVIVNGTVLAFVITFLRMRLRRFLDRD